MIVVEYGGQQVKVDQGQFTAAEAQAFRHAVGARLLDAFMQQTSDVDLIAGVLWILERRRNRALTWKAFSEAFTYDSFELVDSDDADDEDHDPET
jgi:hypothetical protein